MGLVSQSPDMPHHVSRALNNGPGFVAVALKDSEASLLLSGGLNPQSEPVKAYKIDSPVHSINVAGLGYRSQSPKEGEVDHDYVPEDREGEPIPVTFAALKSAGKKRLNEFAPAERGTKKSKTNIQGYAYLPMKHSERNGNKTNECIAARWIGSLNPESAMD